MVVEDYAKHIKEVLKNIGACKNRDVAKIPRNDRNV